MAIVIHKGQTVYAADGTHLGSVLQCDLHCMVIGRGRWSSDHAVIPLEEVAASGPDVLMLRTLPLAVRSETAEAWSQRPDPSGNANGVDIEPLRAGMAEIEDKDAGITPPLDREIGREAAWRGAAQPNDLLPSAEDAWELERERVAQLDTDIEHRLVEEVEDFEIGASCAFPAEVGELREALDHPLARPVEAPRREEGGAAAEMATTIPSATRAAMRATRSKRAFERILHRSGFSRAEARAIATGGFEALVSLVEAQRVAQPSSQP